MLDQYLTLISDVISWIEEEREIISNKGFFKQFLSQKQSSFEKLKKLLTLIAPTSIYIESIPTLVYKRVTLMAKV